ncbi:MAG: CpsD/CapB family tyrosine-protein kinase [candidate division Zixibacteria bacterium]|nr:CpsD/CapB family tyrosine-protein kinase [candidate division Zixibacteria bacterium]
MSNGVSIIDFYNMETDFATEFRRLLHNIRNLQGDADLKSIMVTSAMLAEGKSTVAAFLALTAAKKGMKSLLLDADLRRPTAHRLFGMDRDNGLAEVLSGETTVKSVIRKTSLEKFDIITAGRAVPNPSELFDSRAIGNVITEMKFYYDLIVIDSPPVIPVSDPMLLAQEVDGVLLVVKAGATQREVVSRATDILRSQSRKLLGVVLNNMTNQLPYYYDYSHYGYDYAPRPKDLARSKSKRSRRDQGEAVEDQPPADKSSRQ